MDIYQTLLLLKNDYSISFIISIIVAPILIKYVERIIFNIGIEKIINKYLYGTYNTIEIMAFDSIRMGSRHYEYPKSFVAISFLAYKENKCNKLKNITLSLNNMNYYYNREDNKKEEDDKQNYTIDECKNIELRNNIFMDIIQIENKHHDNEGTDSGDSMSKITMTIKSKKLNITQLRDFINDCVIRYEKYLKNINENKIFHFIYKESEKKKLIFSDQVISDFNDINNMNFETFDNIFHEYKDQIISDIERLKDINYYRKHGLKRKKGYLFYGHPGCGKTSTVMAIANYSKRHIIEIPMSRVKTNSELESIIHINEINNIKFEKDQIILLFDEIDSGIRIDEKIDIDYSNALCSTENICDKDNKKQDKSNNLLELLTTNVSIKKQSDELSLGTLLSRFDGIGSYNGMIIIATTNYKNKLPANLYRCGRLDPLFFGFATKKDIINMIEKYYDIKMTNEQKNNILEEGYKLSHSDIKYYMEHNSMLKLLDQLKFLGNDDKFEH